MPLPPAPPPISAEEFERRWQAGARTIRELDPRFAKWQDDAHLQMKWQAITIIIAGGLLLATVIIVAISRL